MNKLILIVDDEPSIVIALEYLMQREGFDVRVAYDGQAALQAISLHTPDLLLLDLMLPKMDGFEVCQLIRADPALRSIKILMLSAKGRDAEINKGLTVGADAYLSKPFSARELVAQVRQMLGLVAA